MRDLTRHNESEWMSESPMRVSPHTFGALGRILGSTIARGLQQGTTPSSIPIEDANTMGLSGSPKNTCPLPYEWAARHLLAKMRVEAN